MPLSACMLRMIQWRLLGYEKPSQNEREKESQNSIAKKSPMILPANEIAYWEDPFQLNNDTLFSVSSSIHHLISLVVSVLISVVFMFLIFLIGVILQTLAENVEEIHSNRRHFHSPFRPIR